MAEKLTYPLVRERNLIITLFLVLTAASWALLVWQSSMPNKMAMGLTMGMDAPLFLAVWIVMMVATMFPAEAPMVLTFARVYAAKREQGKPFVPTWIFVGSYLVSWSLFGVLAYGVALVVDAIGMQSSWLMANAARLGGGLIVLAGLFQLSPLKNSCLSKCRSPMNFILNFWHEGYLGSFRMGFEHGVFCIGCCWALMIILFPLGMMNVAAMAAVAIIIFAEKTVPMGDRIAKIAAAALIVYGILVIFVPGILPTIF
jgi:predicted metal-binding membrane protein